MKNVIIYANKVSPSPWNGDTASHLLNTNGWSGYGQSNVFFFLRQNGTSFTRDYNGVIVERGSWTTTPATSYEVRCVSLGAG